jgi:Ca-activated chloride channel family protein
MSVRSAVPVVLGSLLALATLASPQQQQPSFKTKIETVSLFVTVTDASGRLVPGLTRQDFTVFDNDVPQTLTIFESAITPFTATVMLDTSLSMALLTTRVKAGAEQFLMRLLPDDRAQVGYFNDKVEFVSDLTGDRDALISSMDRMDFGNPTRLWDALYLSLASLSEVDGRRVAIVFTDGDDTASQRSNDDILERAREQGVMIYAIGLASELRVGTQRIRTQPDRGLRKLAVETGGGFFLLKDQDELGPTFTRVVQELHTQYVLGFTPAVLDGKVHELEVRLKPAGMSARARRSYVAAPHASQATP